MKIDQKVIALNSAALPDAPARAKAGSATAASAGAVPSIATRLPVTSAGEFDAARVAQIREAIAAGRYQVDAGRIADGLLDDVRNLLGERK